MNIEKLNPWNWFKHEEGDGKGHQIPVTRGESGDIPALASGAGSLLRLHREMDDWFDQAFSRFGMPSISSRMLSSGFPGRAMSNLYKPQIDVSGDADYYEIALDVPDMQESDLSIEVKGDVLMIKGQKEERKENRDKQFYRLERSYGSFQRTLALPEDADADEINADLDKGVLRLKIPRRDSIARDNAKRIPISS